MEDIVFFVLIFGAGTAIAIAFSPIGRALADRLRGSVPQVTPSEDLNDVRAQLQSVHEQLSELAERQDFTERLLAQTRDKGAIGPAKEAS